MCWSIINSVCMYAMWWVVATRLGGGMAGPWVGAWVNGCEGCDGCEGGWTASMTQNGRLGGRGCIINSVLVATAAAACDNLTNLYIPVYKIYYMHNVKIK